MKLTHSERGMIWNQLDIMQKLSDDDEHFEKMKLIIERGYEAHYDELFQHISPDEQTLSTQESQEIRDILEMFERMSAVYPDIQDKSGINKDNLYFGGFSSSTESKLQHYAKFLLEQNQYAIRPVHHMNSHVEMLPQYRKMVLEWRISNMSGSLSQEDLERITNAE